MKKHSEQIRFLTLGDSALTALFSTEMSKETNQKIRFLAEQIDRKAIPGICESVPAFCSLTVYFDPLIIQAKTVKRKLLKLMESYKEDVSGKKRIFLIPVCYDGEYAPDMEDVCTLTGLKKQQLIEIHASTDHLIYMLGFLPGFPYLGGLDKRIEAPRLDSPRTAIPAGAVGIGGKQTGIYPLSSPGGWRLIGRTPVKVYDPSKAEPIAYRAGDYIRFYPITPEEFERIADTEDYRIEMKEEEECQP